MKALKNIIGHSGNWLDTLLTAGNPLPTGTVCEHVGCRWQLVAEGVLQIEPREPASEAEHLVISCGIHGNETAPMELVNDIVTDAISGALVIRRRCLIILGNPEAARQQQRFTELNLNRLFGDLSHYSTCPETERALQLRRAVDDFFAYPQGARFHFDLHTAIRGSRFEKFAVSPFGQSLDSPQLNLLGQCGIEAVLDSHAPASTFSHYSFKHWSATAFTLELGRVAPFGQNDLSRLTQIDQLLRSKLTAGRAPEPARLPHVFTVVSELKRQTENYKLLIPEGTPNFTPFLAGTAIDQGENEQYVTTQPDECIVFPNAAVPIGQRTGLMVVKKP